MSTRIRAIVSNIQNRMLIKSAIIMVIVSLIFLPFSRPSHAYVSAIIVAAGAPVCGITVAGIGLIYLAQPTWSLIGYVASPKEPNNERTEDTIRTGVILTLMTSTIAILTGILLDEGGNSRAIQFKKIDLSRGLELNATRAEIESFNSEVDLLNALSENVELQSNDASLKDIGLTIEMWKSALDLVSPLTKSALEKVIQHQFKSIQLLH